MFRSNSVVSRPVLLMLCSAIAAVAAFLLLPGCGDDETTAPAETVDPVAVFLEHGNCKTEGAKGAVDTVSSDRDIVEYTYTGKTLRFHHTNTAFNCCIDSIHADFEMVGDTIRIGESESLPNPGGCRCVCLYDISWEIRNLAVGAYVIDIAQLYLDPGNESHLFAVDLAGAPSGSHEITRAEYPWGDPYAEPAIVFLSRTNCKDLDPVRRVAADSAAADCVQYSYDGSGELAVTHINTAFNCCIDSTPVTVSFDGDTIRIVENEILEGEGCDCLCLYDLEYTVDHLPPGSYRLEITQMYLGGGEELHSYPLELREPVADERCLVRSGYPWY